MAALKASKLSMLVMAIVISAPIVSILAVPFVAVCGPYALGAVHGMIKGPDIVRSAASPDGAYLAYAEEKAGADAPTQTLFVEKRDKTSRLHVAHLSGETEGIREIRWSPSGDVVVFETRANLIVAKTPNFETVSVSANDVESVDFPAPGTVRFQTKGAGDRRVIDTNNLVKSQS